MKISLKWLKEFIDIEKSPEELSEILTMQGLEVENLTIYESVKGSLQSLLIGRVIECDPHPNADKLKLAKVDIGKEKLLNIVCGASNIAKKQKVIVSPINTILYPKDREPFRIKKIKIRGQVSEGMICAEDEIGIGTNNETIIVLDTDLPNGTPAAEYFNLYKDSIFEIDLTPNRADAISHYGIARDLKWILKKEIKFPNLSDFKTTFIDKPVKVKVENNEACPRYVGVTIEGVNVTSSPDWLQEKLKSIGLSPINNIVDTTNYILHSLGQPLHAFDANKIKDREIIVRSARKKEYFTTLDGIERQLSTRDLVICDSKDPICLAGILGGSDSGISQDTKSIFLESAYFSPKWIRNTARSYNLKTDAAFRFERGTDPNICLKAIKMAAILIQQIGGGKITSNIIDIYPQTIVNLQIDIFYEKVNRLIGKTISKEIIKDILISLEIDILKEDEAHLEVSVPAYRVDIKREVDLIEEILRIYGYDNIQVKRQLSSSYLSEFPQFETENVKLEIANMLANSHLQEIITNSLTKPSYSTMINMKGSEDIYMLNSLSGDLSVMRQNMIFSGLEVIAYNINRKQKNLRLFEFGKTYHKREGKYIERETLVLFFTGNNSNQYWQLTTDENADFYQLAKIIYKIFNRFNIVEYEQTPIKNKMFSHGISYGLKNSTLCKAGLVSSRLTQVLDIEEPIFFAEIDWEELFKKLNRKLVYQKISKFPKVRRDLSLIMEKFLTFEEIKKLAYETEKKLLKEMYVFDIYQGKNIGINKKSYAISFILQDRHKTLNDKIIDNTMNRLMNAFEKNLGILIRK